MYDGQEFKVNSFYQKEINSSQIYYKHSEVLNGWTQNDSFEFTINTLYAEPVPIQVLQIYISYGNLNAENKDQLIKTKPVQVDEGGRSVVSRKNLDVSEFIRNLERIGKKARLTFSLRGAPLHGTLKYSGTILSPSVRFSQQDINSRKLSYIHDDSDTVLDTFNLTLHLSIKDDLQPGVENEETTFGLVLNITVRPVNDEPFKLLTEPSLRVIQGFTAVINQSMLNTVDKDTRPPYIVYKITREATNGHVAFVENPAVPINLFTQQDINDGRVVFQHDFNKDSGNFHFQISDGSFGPVFRIFRINVTKVFVDLNRNTTLFLVQSNTTASLTQENMNVSTNGFRHKIRYYLLRQPRYGKLYASGREITSFTQDQIDSHRVMYVQTDLKSGSDIFEFSILYRHDDYTEVVFYNRVPMYIRVKPLVAVGPLEAPKGERVALTLLSLDASLLAERTGDDPVYSIQQGPYFGNIVKSERGKRQIYTASNQNPGYKIITEFRHEDIVYMKIFYKSNVHNTPVRVQDNFTYVLKAYSVQPAEGVFYIGLTPSNNIPLVPVTVSPDSSGEHVTHKAVTQPGDRSSQEELPGNKTVEPSPLQNHVIILAISVPLFLLIVTIAIICLVRKRRRKQDFVPAAKKSLRPRPHISGPLQIEQPHVHIQPQEKGSPVSEESKSLIVEYENTTHIPRNTPLNTPRNTTRNPISRSEEEEDVVTPMIMTLPTVQHNVPRSPDISRTEISSAVPACKVTPLVEQEDELEGGACYGGENRTSMSSMEEMLEWITNAPDLLHHCSSSSPPALRKSQYWV